MFAFGLAGFGAGGLNCRVNDLGVSRCGNLFLCNKNFVADGAMFALGLAGCGAGWLDCRVDDLGVSLRGNFLLCNDDRVADRAMFALALTGLGAGGFHCRVNDLGVSLRGNDLLCNDDRVADGAVFTLSLAGCGAGWLDCRVDDLGMSLRGYFLHAGESLAADRALCAGCMTSLGAGCGLLGNFNGSMTGSIDCFGFGLVADRAGVGLDAGILTGRRGRDLALIPTVALGGNLFLCNKNLVADGAMFAFGLAGCGASSFNSFVDHLGMTRSGDFLNSGNRCAADRALGAGCVSVLSAGCGLFSNINGSMTGSRNNLTVADLLIAVRAVGIAGVAWLGAGCFLGITKFCVLMCARRAAPYAFDIVDNIASLGSLRLGVGAVGVVQLGGGDGD